MLRKNCGGRGSGASPLCRQVSVTASGDRLSFLRPRHKQTRPVFPRASVLQNLVGSQLVGALTPEILIRTAHWGKCIHSSSVSAPPPTDVKNKREL